MRKPLIILALLFLGASFASWVRMCDPLLSMRPWNSLLDKPFKLWVGSIVFYPVFELLYAWPAYLLGGIIFFAVIKKCPNFNRAEATASGAIIGFTIYLLHAFVHAQWLLQTHSLVIKEALIYTLSGAVFGFCYQYCLLRSHSSETPLTR